ncbi:zinc metalloprotease, putative, partial [Ixodes scapularis]
STLYNFVFWKLIRTYGSVASKELEKLVFEFNKEALGVKKDEPLWKKCITKISGSMAHAVGRLYVDKMFDPKAKKTVSKTFQAPDKC